MQRLLGMTPRPESEMFPLNMSMHYGQGAVAGVIRALMSVNGIRGPFADFMFIGVRLAIDQTLENWMGTGALPWYVSFFLFSFFFLVVEMWCLVWDNYPFKVR